MILIVDNFEREGCSAAEMAQALAARRQHVAVYGNDCIGLDQVAALNPALIVLSPGFCSPAEAGFSVAIVQRFAGQVPILGIGQGFHCIAAAFGASLRRAKRILHMSEDQIIHDGQGVFAGLPSPIQAIRSHSVVINECSMPEELSITARSIDHDIMGVRHRQFSVEGVQFRPVVESHISVRSGDGLTRPYTFADLLWGAKEFSTPRGNRIETVDVTGELLQFLREDETNIFKITPEQFELLIADRLDVAGFDVSRVGHTYAHDGGIDLIACPRFPVPFPFILAVQAKHHRGPERKTGVRDVQVFAGALGHYQLQAGALITNTAFSPNAHWLAKNQSKLLMLRDLNDLRRWLRDNFVDLAEARDLPLQIVLGKDVIVDVPRFSRVWEANGRAGDAQGR